MSALAGLAPPLSPTRSRVLVVDVDDRVGGQLIEQLRADGFAARLARSAGHARAIAAAELPHAVLLCAQDGGHASMGLLAEIRSCDANAPWDITAGVIVAGAQVGELDVLRAFEWGADDFMAYPPRYLELRARLCALLRRTGDRTPRRRLNVGLLEVDTLARTAQLRGQPVALSRLEFALLTHLASEPERVFTRQELLGEVWGFRSPSRTLDSHACRLRRKLAWSGERWVVNVRGVGYRLHDRSSARPSRS